MTDSEEMIRKRIDAENAERALSVASKVGLAGAFGYMALVYLAGIQGIFREFALVFAGGIGWLLWRLVLSSYD